MRLYILMTSDEIAKLQSLANQERRRPQEQAAYLLSKVLSDQLPAGSDDEHSSGASSQDSEGDDGTV